MGPLEAMFDWLPPRLAAIPLTAWPVKQQQLPLVANVLHATAATSTAATATAATSTAAAATNDQFLAFRVAWTLVYCTIYLFCRSLAGQTDKLQRQQRQWSTAAAAATTAKAAATWWHIRLTY